MLSIQQSVGGVVASPPYSYLWYFYLFMVSIMGSAFSRFIAMPQSMQRGSRMTHTSHTGSSDVFCTANSGDIHDPCYEPSPPEVPHSPVADEADTGNIEHVDCNAIPFTVSDNDDAPHAPALSWVLH